MKTKNLVHKKRKVTPTSRQKDYSLVTRQAMGGIHGGEGYTFQDRYTVCQIPKLLADTSFIRLMPEGTGDLDLVFNDNGDEVYEHIQVKDHQVTFAEFKSVLDTFIEIDKGTKQVYRKFTLACPSGDVRVSSLITTLKRYKESKPFFTGKNARATDTSLTALKAKFQTLGLSKYFDFVERKVEFETGQSEFSDNQKCIILFASTLAQHPYYRKKFLNSLKPAYSVLLAEVLSRKGKLVQGTELKRIIDSVLSGSKDTGKSTVLHIHNWTVEKFDNKATISLDWSNYFDRQNRGVPTTTVWDTQLIPELIKVRKSIETKTSNRHIIFRGKCALSTGIALGMTFPEIGNWTFELFQPPQMEAWRSDTEIKKPYKVKSQVVPPSKFGIKTGTEIALLFNITGKALDAVTEYLKQNGIGVKKLIIIQPDKGSGITSIENDSEAISLANDSKNILKDMRNKYQSTKTHLFFYGPLALGVFLGQKLTSVGAIQLYEFQDPGYTPSVLIKT